MSLHSFFPWTPRTAQSELMDLFDANWSQYDVFVGAAPVAVGKSPLAVAVGRWRESRGEGVAIITHNNVLVDQYLNSFPDLPHLHKSSRYGGGYMFAQARGRAQKSNLVLSNYYTYVANKLHRETLIIDEAHNVLQMLKERWTRKLWQKKWNFPDEMRTFEDFLGWAETHRDPEIDEIVKQVVEEQTFTLQYSTDVLRGREERVLNLIPLTVRHQRPWLWNHKVRKIVLLSATISEWELHELGLDTRRVLYAAVDSPIPAANRPFIIDPVANMSLATRPFAIDALAQRLKQDLETRQGKGVIHATYETAARLRSRLFNKRLIWHTSADRQQKYEEFRAAPGDAVFVASGFSEGIDLAYDAARWQVICELPHPNLGDPAIRIKADQSPDWYNWQTVKVLLQTIGRVCRAPDDYGETYIYDSRFRKFFAAAEKMWPRHVIHSFRWRS